MSLRVRHIRTTPESARTHSPDVDQEKPLQSKGIVAAGMVYVMEQLMENMVLQTVHCSGFGRLTKNVSYTWKCTNVLQLCVGIILFQQEYVLAIAAHII